MKRYRNFKYIFFILIPIAILISFSFYNNISQKNFKYKDYNVVFVSFDALQAAHVHSLGYPLEITPTIDMMAENGYSFKQAISASSWTVPASMTWFTGVYPSQHKVVNKFTVYTNDSQVVSNLKKLSPEIVTLAEILKQSGYATGGFTGDSGVNGVFGFNQGFDTYFDNTSIFSGFDTSMPRALEWIKQNKDKKFFLFLHGYDVHGQYEPSGGFDYRFVDFAYNGPYNGSKVQQASLREERLQKGYLNLTNDDVRFWRAIYDEKINRADGKFAMFLDEFKKLGIMDKTIFIITSDHGTEFYEHEGIDHGFTLYDELIHVPLIIVLPNQEKGAVIDNQVRSLDLMPTILDLLGIPVNKTIKNQMQGVSLVPFMKGEKLNLDAYSETDYRLYTFKRSLRTSDGWKFILTLENKNKELYNLANDPGETKNLVDVNPAKAYELEQKLLKHLILLNQTIYEEWETGCSPVYPSQCQNV
jgi:arylsulfatase A-like enzyme